MVIFWKIVLRLEFSFMLYFSKKVVHPETRYLRWIMTRWQTEENNYHSFWFMQVMLHFNSSNSKEFLFISFQWKNNYYSIMCILKHYSLILWYIVIYKRISKKARKKMITLICWIFACYWSWTFLIIRPIHAKLKLFFFLKLLLKGLTYALVSHYFHFSHQQCCSF